MKIAVTYENGQVFQHFGHTENFKIYEITNDEVISSAVISTNGDGHGALTGFLKDHGVNILICGGIGGGARNALNSADIEIYGGVTGDADVAVNNYLSGSLLFDPNAKCSHHEHQSEHTCGSHGCGTHNCH